MLEQQKKLEATSAVRKEIKKERTRIQAEALQQKRKQYTDPDNIEKLLGSSLAAQVAGIGGVDKNVAGKAGIDDRKGEGGWSGAGDEEQLEKPKKGSKNNKKSLTLTKKPKKWTPKKLHQKRGPK